MGNSNRYTGGCLCGAVRYEAHGAPHNQGYCCCGDCRRASGSGFIPFIGFSASDVRFTGETQHSIVPSARGTEAVRNHCAKCGSLVFGGVVGKDSAHTIYAGSLDEPALFQPTMAIFTRGKPPWVVLPAGLKMYETLPGL